MELVTGSGGARVAVHLDGPADGRPVVLLHGWPDSHRLWRHQVAALGGAGWRTIALDLRGFGESDRPEHVDAYHVRHTVADVLAVLDHLGLERAAVVAHDWGAAAGWGLAATAPDRVERYAALSVGHPASFRAVGLEQLMRSWYMLLFQFEGVAETFLTRSGRLLLASHPDRDEVLAEWADPARLRAQLGWYRANAHPRSLVTERPALPPVRCPVLGVWSTKDFALVEEGMRGSGPYVEGGFRYERVEGAGHWMMLDRPDVVTELLLDFLG